MPTAKGLGRERRAIYFLGLCAALIGVQARAQVIQLAAGFRPFGPAAKRVAFSWDMFAVAIERCEVTWDPPLSIEGRRVARWHDRGTYFEWDTAKASVDGYQQEALNACDYRTAPLTTIEVICLDSSGERSGTTFPCP